MKPLLKWAGGKRDLAKKIAPVICKHLAETGGTYYEPFLGSAAVALAIGPRHVRVLNDAIPDLMIFYAWLQTMPVALFAEVDTMANWSETPDGRYFALIRETRYQHGSVRQAARVMFLNRTCYNGLWRESKKSGFNVPKGGTPSWPAWKSYEAASDALSGATLTCEDFQISVDHAKQGDLIYADPPYFYPKGVNGHTNYTAAGFGLDDQVRLAQGLCRAFERGVSIIASNSDTEFTRDLYNWANISSRDESRPINSDKTKRGKAPCLLIAAG